VRSRVLVTIAGESRTYQEWSEISGTPPDTIRLRRKAGFSDYAAVFGSRYTHDRVLKPVRAPVWFPVGFLPRWGSVSSVSFRA
jgi:hypothetical protein